MRYTRVKDCPICGSQALLITEELSNGRGGYPGKYDYRYTCPHCEMIKANGGDTVYLSKEDAIEKAIEFWNAAVDKVEYYLKEKEMIQGETR